MYVTSIDDVKAEEVNPDHAEKATVRWLLSQEIGVPNFEMRYFEFEAGGYTKEDRHPFEHEVFVVRGEGTVVGENGERKLKPGDAIYIAPNEVHHFKNQGTEPFGFICLIPKGLSRAGKK